MTKEYSGDINALGIFIICISAFTETRDVLIKTRSVDEAIELLDNIIQQYQTEVALRTPKDKKGKQDD